MLHKCSPLNDVNIYKQLYNTDTLCLYYNTYRYASGLLILACESKSNANDVLLWLCIHSFQETFFFRQFWQFFSPFMNQFGIVLEELSETVSFCEYRDY